MNARPGSSIFPSGGSQAPAGTDTVRATNAFAELVHALAKERQSPMAAVSAGFAEKVLRDAAPYFDVRIDRISAIVGPAQTTAHSPSYEGLLRLAEVTAMAQEVFDDAEVPKSWLRSTNLTFNDRAPMDYLDSEAGAKAVRQVLNAIACGGAL